MSNAYDVLKERGFIEQTTHEEEIRDLFKKNRITFYIGFDPTSDSLTAGHFLTVMAMAHLQQHGHRPIVLIGGGTAMIGDPTGKTDMRKMMTSKKINDNADCFKKQLSRFIEFGNNKAVMVNNADWLLNLNYVEFLREIGVHFSVNRMLTAECYKSRMDRGLTFLEFNYMLMQSYDFLELNKKYNCVMQLGGNDQWSNILGGVELIRRKTGTPAYGMTLKLLTTSEGKKMGKTESGAIWLDAKKTSPYDFFQYWRNIEDTNVERCLSLLTFLPMEEVKKLASLKGSDINKAKEVLAYELTKIIHGESEAEKAMKAAKSLFGKGSGTDDMPSTKISFKELDNGINILDLLLKTGLIPSKGEGRRLVKQGGIYMNDTKIKQFDLKITRDDFKNNELLLRRGKKSYHKIIPG